MKKIILVFLLISNVTIFGQFWFIEPTSSHIDSIGITGEGPIAYEMQASSSYIVQSWYARLQYPDGSWSNWMEGRTGGWWVNKAGTYHIKGKIYAKNWVLGTAYQWIEKPKFSFLCVDNYAPEIPQNLSATWSNDHPKLIWSANSEMDMSHYEIYKKKNSPNYSYYNQTTSTYFVDNAEIRYNFGGENKTYVFYKILSADINGHKSDLSGSVSACVSGGIEKRTAEDSDGDNPNAYKLFQNYPNPFNPETSITYQLPENGFVSLRIFNMLGETVATLVNNYEEAGMYAVFFNANDFPSGLYIAKLQTSNYSETIKMVLMK